jgi:hypothetical protein
MMTSLTSVTMYIRGPKRSLNASLIVWRLTAARRPDISTRKITQMVPSTTTQIS